MDQSRSVEPDVLNARCPSRKVLELLADKWTLLVIAALSRGVRRNGQLLREVDGVSQKMLTQTLRNLEQKGLVAREVHEIVPPRVEYSLTPLGGTLIGPIRTLGGWAEQHYDEVESSEKRYAEARDLAG